MTALLCLLLAASDPRLVDAERLAAAGDVEAAYAAMHSVYDELHKSDASASASLHYNLGTLALQRDDLGNAMVHLLAAEKRMPGDDDVRHNLDLALTRRADQVQGTRQNPVGALIPPHAVRIAAAASWALLGLALLLLSSGKSSRTARAAVRVCAAASIVSGALLAMRLHAESIDTGVVMRDAKALPQPDAQAQGFDIHAGLTGRVVAEQEGFVRLRLENGVDVWTSRDAVVVVP